MVQGFGALSARVLRVTQELRGMNKLANDARSANGRRQLVRRMIEPKRDTFIPYNCLLK